MPRIRFDHFLRYAELTELLRSLAAEYPQLLSIESIGRSHEGRDIWLATVTQRARGEPGEKPAFWVDGNIHSTEVAASAACIYFLQLPARQVRPGPGGNARAGHAHLLPLPAHQSRWRRMGARRQAEVRPLQHAHLSLRRGRHRGPDASRTSTATGASCRCASPMRTDCGRPIRRSRG